MTTSSASARAELGAFLRSRRERLSPQGLGLPAGGRRRTPGLRREEVAMLAGVGVTWYTWLEQGREINPSPEVLDAVCRALRLDPDERNHVWLLAAARPAPGAADESACGVVTEDHLALLEHLLPLPACIQTAKFDILASNSSYRFLIDDFDTGPVEDRNCLIRAFLDPAWAAAYRDYPRVTSRMVARLRASMAAHLDDPAWTGLVARMRRESALFSELWDRHELTHEAAYRTDLRSPRAGDVSVRLTRLWIEAGSTVRITVMRPIGAADMRAFERLAAAVQGEPLVTARPALHALLAEDRAA